MVSYIGLGCIHALSYLPFGALYLISDIFYLLIYGVFKYRIKVTRNNLKKSFPHLSDNELIRLEKKFYKHFCDLVVETVKSFSISESVLKKRMWASNPEILNQYLIQGRSVLAVTGHYGNWEWAAMSLALQSNIPSYGLYMPLKNKVFNRTLINSRSRFGVRLVSVKEVSDRMAELLDTQCVWGFIVDQSPSKPDKGYWTTFLNQETGVSKGTERYARSNDMVVLFGKITKLKRGHYTLTYHLICEQANAFSEGGISIAHSQYLEEIIKEEPAYWLWTHKRWKHKRPAEMELLP
jgi:KDO2-lipid IV(A) lauroyltransferase